MATAFLGYVLPWGLMSFWGSAVIINSLDRIPNLLPFLLGDLISSSNTLSRFFIFHFIIPFILLSILIFHLIFLHSPSSNNPLSFNFNNKISFFPSLYLKDFFYFMSLTLALFYEEILFTILTFSHPDNYFEASSLNTPNHIVPE